MIRLLPSRAQMIDDAEFNPLILPPEPPLTNSVRLRFFTLLKTIKLRMNILLLLAVIFILIAAYQLNHIAANNHNDKEIALMGDSLVYDDRSGQGRDIATDLYGILHSVHPNTKLRVFYSRHPGDRIARLRARMYRDILKRRTIIMLIQYYLFGIDVHLPPPDMVIIYYDSDISDVNETKETVDAIRNAYGENLRFVLASMSAEIRFVALAGPSVLGELQPNGRNYKDKQLDEYMVINRNIAEEFNVTYINTRLECLERTPANWSSYTGYFTSDGEHHNRRGQLLLVELFSKVLLDNF